VAQVVTRRRLVGLSAILAVLVAVAIGGYRLTRSRVEPPRTLNQRQAEQLVAQHRLDTIGHLPGVAQLGDTSRSSTPCPDKPGPSGRVQLTYTFDVAFDPNAPAVAPGTVFPPLQTYWNTHHYRVLEDDGASAQTRHVLVENPADGFRIGVTQRLGRLLKIAVSTSCVVPAAPAVPFVLTSDLVGPIAQYREYVAGQLTQLDAQVSRLHAAIASGEIAAAQTDWLAAALIWEQVGAAYGSFAELGEAIGGLPQGLPLGVADPSFTGLRRIEYGLWHGQTSGDLLTIADQLVADVRELRGNLPDLTIEPADLPLRAHEILEDALRKHLSGQSDQGGGASYAETDADVQGTRVVLSELAPLINERRKDLLPTAAAKMDAMQQALRATQHDGVWTRPADVPPAARLRINAALGDLLETLAPVPALLELRDS
jgi:hypothetical protein